MARHSDEVANKIDIETRRIIEESHSRAKALIEENRDKLERLAQALLKYETLSGDEVRAIIRGEDIDEIRKRRTDEENKTKEQAKPEETTPSTEDEKGWKPGQDPLPGPAEA